MSKKINLNLINVTNGINHLSGFFSGRKYVYPYGCSRRVLPRSAVPHRYESKYVKEDFYECHTKNLIKHTILARMTGGISSNYVTSKTKTFTVKWFDTVCFGSKSAPGMPIKSYYDTPNPQCPPLDPKPCKPPKIKCPTRSNPCVSPCPKQMPPCCPKKEKKKSPCGLRLSTSFSTIEAKFNGPDSTIDPYPLICLFKKDPLLEVTEKGCPPPPTSSAKLYLSTKCSNEKNPCGPPKKCPSCGNTGGGCSCPPSSKGPKKRDPCAKSGANKGGCPSPPKSSTKIRDPCARSKANKGGCPSPPKSSTKIRDPCARSKANKGGCPPPPKCPSKKRDPCARSGAKKGGCPPPPKCPSKRRDPCARSGKSPTNSLNRGPVCPPQKKVKDCPPARKGRKGPVCPPQKKVKDCPPARKGGKGPVCPTRKKVKGCPPKRGLRGKCSPTAPVKKTIPCKPLIKGSKFRGPVCPTRKPTGCANVQEGPVTECPPRSSSEKRKSPLIQRAPSCPPSPKKT